MNVGQAKSLAYVCLTFQCCFEMSQNEYLEQHIYWRAVALFFLVLDMDYIDIGENLNTIK